jgi:hypothetical protein
MAIKKVTPPPGKTIDECVDEIFKTTTNQGNKPAWRTAKTRFYDKKLSLKAKERLLKQFGYVKVQDAAYEKKAVKPRKNKKA